MVLTPSEVAKFIRNMEHKTIVRCYKGISGEVKQAEMNLSEMEEAYQLADQYAMAAACCDDVITDTKPAFAYVETGNSESRGRLVVDWNEKGSNSYNVTIIKSADMRRLKLMLFNAFNIH